jgi:hypothetical protein
MPATIPPLAAPPSASPCPPEAPAGVTRPHHVSGAPQFHSPAARRTPHVCWTRATAPCYCGRVRTRVVTPGAFLFAIACIRVAPTARPQRKRAPSEKQPCFISNVDRLRRRAVG